MTDNAKEVFQKIDDMLVIHLTKVCPQLGIPLLFADQYEMLQHYIDYAKTNLDNFYSELCWHKDLKQKSFIIGFLLENKSFLDSYNITIDEAVMAICSLLNYKKCNGKLNRLPNRYITRRTETSKAKIQSLFIFLSVKLPQIFEIKSSYGEILIKVNEKQLLEDKYIKLKCKKFNPKDMYYMAELMKDLGTIYFNKLSKRTLMKRIKEIIIGISIVYTNLIDKYITPEKQLKDQQTYGKRKDIMYIEVPIHIISKALNISSKEVLRILNQTCKSSTYISRHNKVYVDGQWNHYYNENYKDTQFSTKLVDYKEEPIQEGKRPVTAFSYIIHKEEFDKCSISKRIKKNLSEYENIIIRELTKYSIDKNYGKADNFYKDFYEFDEEELNDMLYKNNEIIESSKQQTYTICDGQLEYSEEYVFDPEDLYSEEPNMSVKSLKHINKSYDKTEARTKKTLTLTGVSHIYKIKEMCYCLKDVIERLGSEETNIKDFNQYLKMVDILKEKILDKLNEFKNNSKKLSRLKLYISKFNLETILGYY